MEKTPPEIYDKYIKALMDISQAITSDQYLEDILKLIVMVTAKVTGVVICSLWLIDETETHGKIRLKATQAIDPDYVKDRSLNMNEGVVGVCGRPQPVSHYQGCAEGAPVQEGNGLTFGRLQVLDVSDLEKPRLVAWYEPTDGGVHNIWVAGDTLYMGNYQGGARAVDISGELRGDLLRQGREMAWTYTADDKGAKPRATFAWGAVVKDGTIYVPDINTGLWILRREPKGAPTP